ncbi:LuxR C-terminal-related transcriptional regulator [Nocardioides sp. R1-1]|uniref:LuxR C-terminal-related transcriptional regulator n=1 Tax=Nocardioides sp. R1-1 TaxID=3383502 RepID=UPI0038CFCFDB
MTGDEQRAEGVALSEVGGWEPLADGPHVDEARAYLDEHPGPVDLPVAHPLLPRVACVLARQGRTEEAVSVVAALRGLGLDLDDDDDRERVQHVADLVALRIWAAWFEQRTDEEAVHAARRLLAPSASLALDSPRLASLRLALTVGLFWSREVGERAVLHEIALHLNHLRSQAALLGNGALEASALARLALLQVPSADVEAGARLAAAALSRIARMDGDAAPSAAMSYWHFLARAVEQWACHFQGRPTDAEAIAALEEGMARFAFDPVAATVAGTVVAAHLAHDGRVREARSLLGAVLADRRFDDLGVWRLRPLVTDGYLAATSGDAVRVQERVVDLTQAGAPGEALLLRATQLVADGENAAALTALRGVTERQVRSSGMTFASACVLEAMLLEQSGQPALADRSVRQALGATEPIGARRLFAMHDLPVMTRLVQRAAEGRPQDAWAHEVLEFLHDALSAGLRPAPIAVRPRTRAQGAGGPDGLPAAEPSVRTNPSPLTERELQVLGLVNAGASQAQMAQELYVSLNTIKTHLRSIRQKLGVARTGEAAAVARSAGWLEPS